MKLFSTNVYRCRRSSDVDEMLVYNFNAGYNLGILTGISLGVFLVAVVSFAADAVKKANK